MLWAYVPRQIIVGWTGIGRKKVCEKPYNKRGRGGNCHGMLFIFYAGAGEVQGYGEDELSKLVVRLDLGLNLRFVRDKKTTIKLLPSQPEKRKTWTNINFESLQGVNFRLCLAPLAFILALELPPLFWVCIRHSYSPCNP